MPFNTGEILRFDFVQQLLNQTVVNVFFFECLGTSTAQPSNVGQTWWDATKAAFRAWMPVSPNFTALEVKVTGLNVGGDMGSYTIPVAEQQGTRAIGASEFMPSFVAGTIRFGVATRLTRPGSKRVAGFLETDVTQNLIVAATLTPLIAVGEAWDNAFQLGTPAVTFRPVIVKRKTPMVPPFVSQPVVNSITSGLIKSQVSRRLGNGR